MRLAFFVFGNGFCAMCLHFRARCYVGHLAGGRRFRACDFHFRQRDRSVSTLVVIASPAISLLSFSGYATVSKLEPATSGVSQCDLLKWPVVAVTAWHSTAVSPTVAAAFAAPN